MTDKQPSTFAQQWQADRLLKRAKKKARKTLQQRGFSHGQATAMVKQTIKRMTHNDGTQS